MMGEIESHGYERQGPNGTSDQMSCGMACDDVALRWEREWGEECM